MSKGNKERNWQQLAKSRRDYSAQVKMLTVDERTREGSEDQQGACRTPGAERHRCCGDFGRGPGCLHSVCSGQLAVMPS